LDRLETGQEQLREDLGQQMRTLREDLGGQMRVFGEDLGQQMRALGEDLGQQMRVLYEDLVDRIKALPEHAGPTREDFNTHRDRTELRLSTLELVVRQHNADIDELKSSRG
jgi:hypothetical protein